MVDVNLSDLFRAAHPTIADSIEDIFKYLLIAHFMNHELIWSVAVVVPLFLHLAITKLDLPYLEI